MHFKNEVHEHQRFHRNYALFHQSSAKIFIDINRNGMEDQYINLTHGILTFRLTKCLCTMLICCCDSKGNVNTEFIPPRESVTAMFYFSLMRLLFQRIRRTRLEYREESWPLHHDNAPSHCTIFLPNVFTKHRASLKNR